MFVWTGHFAGSSQNWHVYFQEKYDMNKKILLNFEINFREYLL